MDRELGSPLAVVPNAAALPLLASSRPLLALWSPPALLPARQGMQMGPGLNLISPELGAAGLRRGGSLTPCTGHPPLHAPPTSSVCLRLVKTPNRFRIASGHDVPSPGGARGGKRSAPHPRHGAHGKCMVRAQCTAHKVGSTKPGSQTGTRERWPCALDLACGLFPQ